MWHRDDKLTASRLNERLQGPVLIGSHLILVRILSEEDWPESPGTVPVSAPICRDLSNGALFVHATTSVNSDPAFQVKIKVYLPGTAVPLFYSTVMFAEWNSRLVRWDILDAAMATADTSSGNYDCRLDTRSGISRGPTTSSNLQCQGWARPCYEMLAWAYSRFFYSGLTIPKTSTYSILDEDMPESWTPPSLPYSTILEEGGVLTHDGVVSGQNQWSTKWNDLDWYDGEEWVAREDDTWGISFSFGEYVFSLPESGMESILYAPLRLNPRLMTAPLSTRPPSWLMSCRGEITWPSSNVTLLEDLSATFSYGGGPEEGAELTDYYWIDGSEQAWRGHVIKCREPGAGAGAYVYVFQIYMPLTPYDPVLVACFRFDDAKSPERLQGSLLMSNEVLWDWLYYGVTGIKLFEWEGVGVYGTSS